MSEINQLAQTAFNTAIIRGKTGKEPNHMAAFYSKVGLWLLSTETLKMIL